MTLEQMISQSLKNIFSPEDQELLLKQLLANSPKISRQDAAGILRWAQGVRMDNALIDSVLAGQVSISFAKDGKMQFEVTPAGKAAIALDATGHQNPESRG